MLIDVFVYRLCHETIADYALAADACDALTLSLALAFVAGRTGHEARVIDRVYTLLQLKRLDTFAQAATTVLTCNVQMGL